MTGTGSESEQIPLMLIHGAWLSARSWENFADYFGERGFACPRRSGRASTATSRSCATTPTSSRASACTEIVDHYEALDPRRSTSRRC